jgi:hypothetical protein
MTFENLILHAVLGTANGWLLGQLLIRNWKAKRRERDLEDRKLAIETYGRLVHNYIPFTGAPIHMVSGDTCIIHAGGDAVAKVYVTTGTANVTSAS